MDLRDYLRLLRRRWLLIVLFTLLGICAATAVTLLTEPTYRATSLVYVAVRSTGDAADLAQGGSFAQDQVKSFAEAASQPIVLEPVIDELGLNESAVQLGESVVASAPPDTANIEIAVERDSPDDAAELANAVTASFQRVVADITAPTTGEPSPITVSVLRPATVPDRPASPNVIVNLTLGLLLGLALGLAVAVLRDVLDTRIRSVRDVAAITDRPVIGSITFDPGARRRPLIVQADPRSARAEAFRTLRTNLRFLKLGPGPRSFVVTSPGQSEGKSTTAANLAIALAEAGSAVALIDADLRRSKIAEYMGLEGAVGLSDILVDEIPLADAVQPWGGRGLSVLPAGSTPPNPSELLGSQEMSDLLGGLDSSYDTVIFDAPPLLPVTDAALLAAHTRGALVVVAAGRTRKAELTAALGALNAAGAHIAGIVMTMLPAKGPDALGYGGYRYEDGTDGAPLPAETEPKRAAGRP